MQNIEYYFGNPGTYWVADYVYEHGTWNTGIIILENRISEQPLKTGYGQALKNLSLKLNFKVKQPVVGQ